MSAYGYTYLSHDHPDRPQGFDRGEQRDAASGADPVECGLSARNAARSMSMDPLRLQLAPTAESLARRARAELAHLANGHA